MSDDESSSSSRDNITLQQLASRYAAAKSGSDESSSEQDEPTFKSEEEYTHASKKQKTSDDAEPDTNEENLKPAARLPLAPTLADYLTNEGPSRYAPRPEWCNTQSEPAEYYSRPSSPHPTSAVAAAAAFSRREAFGPLAEGFGFGVPFVYRGVMPPMHQQFLPRFSDGEDGINEDDIEEERELINLQRPPNRFTLRHNAVDQDGDGKGDEVDVPLAVYGADHDSALHLAIKEKVSEAAIALIKSGANIEFPNGKGVTPLMVASLNGNIEVVRALLQKGAQPNAVSARGSTALIQACHFGKIEVVEELIKYGAAIELANYKNTTALMRACQEGHEDVVELLLMHECEVNRRNDERMSALMLSSQRGHAGVVKLLIKADASINAVTNQNSTSLMLAVKRRHLEVVKLLVAAGAELNMKDSKNRTVLETAKRREFSDFEEILTDETQVKLMQQDSRKIRNFLMVRSWNLLQSERATLKIPNEDDISIHQIAGNLNHRAIKNVCPSKQALFRTWTMPAPVMELIASFIPLPLIYETRLQLLSSRAQVDPDSAVYSTMDFIDEVLEEGRLLNAFDQAKVEPPSTFSSWSSFKKWCGQCDVILSTCTDGSAQGIHSMDDSQTIREVSATAQEQRRCMNYLHVLAHAPPNLTEVLQSYPFNMSSVLLNKLKSVQDIQTIARKQAGVHFDTNIANDLVTLARMAVNWTESRSYY